MFSNAVEYHLKVGGVVIETWPETLMTSFVCDTNTTQETFACSCWTMLLVFVYVFALLVDFKETGIDSCAGVTVMTPVMSLPGQLVWPGR